MKEIVLDGRAEYARLEARLTQTVKVDIDGTVYECRAPKSTTLPWIQQRSQEITELDEITELIDTGLRAFLTDESDVARLHDRAMDPDDDFDMNFILSLLMQLAGHFNEQNAEQPVGRTRRKAPADRQAPANPAKKQPAAQVAKKRTAPRKRTATKPTSSGA